MARIRYAGQALQDALAAAALNREKTTQAIPQTIVDGAPMKGHSRGFDETGASVGEFAQAANDPKSRKYFQNFVAQLNAFDGIDPNVRREPGGDIA